MSNKLFSIVIPVYNASNTLSKTVQSVLQQTCSDWELIVVDDKSTDNSVEIAKRLVEQDKRIRLIQSPTNSGSAKKPIEIGVANAIGDYCLYIGHDDEIASDYLAILRSEIEAYHADIVLPIMVQKAIGSNNEQRENPIIPVAHKMMSGKEACRLTIPNWKIGCNGMAFRRGLYKNVPKENPYYYAFSDEYSERILLYAATKVVQSSAQYIYWQRPESITHKMSVKLFEQLCVDEQLVDFAEKNYDTILRNQMQAVMASRMITLYKKYLHHRHLFTSEQQSYVHSLFDKAFDRIHKDYRPNLACKQRMYFSNRLLFDLFCRIMS